MLQFRLKRTEVNVMAWLLLHENINKILFFLIETRKGCGSAYLSAFPQLRTYHVAVIYIAVTAVRPNKESEELIVC